MLEVKTPDEVLQVIAAEFSPLADRVETVPLAQAIGRVLAEDVVTTEYVPDFNRSTVDGYALRARDTFGCSDAIPAILPLAGEVLMGEDAAVPLAAGTCVYVPTGGAVPEGADSVVMIEYTEDYGDGTIGIAKSTAPGQNMISVVTMSIREKTILQKGRVLGSQDIGALAAIGKTTVYVARKLRRRCYFDG